MKAARGVVAILLYLLTPTLTNAQSDVLPDWRDEMAIDRPNPLVETVDRLGFRPSVPFGLSSSTGQIGSGSVQNPGEGTHDTHRQLLGITLAPEMEQEIAPTMKPWNLGLRFALELSALGAMGWWGFEQGEGLSRYAMMVGIPLLGAAIWGTFAVEGDPSRSGETLIAVPGLARLALELGLFGFSTWALSDMGQRPMSIGLGSGVVFHYAVSYERVLWLLSR